MNKYIRDKIEAPKNVQGKIIGRIYENMTYLDYLEIGSIRPPSLT